MIFNSETNQSYHKPYGLRVQSQNYAPHFRCQSQVTDPDNLCPTWLQIGGSYDPPPCWIRIFARTDYSTRETLPYIYRFIT